MIGFDGELWSLDRLPQNVLKGPASVTAAEERAAQEAGARPRGRWQASQYSGMCAIKWSSSEQWLQDSNRGDYENSYGLFRNFYPKSERLLQPSEKGRCILHLNP